MTNPDPPHNPTAPLPASTSPPKHRDAPFIIALALICSTYLLLILAMLAANGWFLIRQTPAENWLTHNPLTRALANPNIQYATWLSLLSCTLAALLSVIVAVPAGYLLARCRFPGKRLLDALVDVPIVLPPLVIGLSLLILFQFTPDWIRHRVQYEIPAVVLAQFTVAAAFAIRTMTTCFEQIDPRPERVALTLGASRAQGFFLLSLPQASRGILTAYTLAWARSLGEFGPLLIFAGATRMKTEVLSTTIFLELSVGDLDAAVAVAVIMIAAAAIVLLITRIWGTAHPAAARHPGADA